MLNLPQIQELIQFVAESGVQEVKLENDDFKLTIKAKPEYAQGEGMQNVQNMMAQFSAMQAAAPQMHIPGHAAHSPIAVAPAAPAPTAAETAQAAQVASDAAQAVSDAKLVTIKSPMIGTFYRAAGPDKPNFVEIGATIKPSDKLCIIEAMKLFNEIEAEISGKIVKILVDNAQPVEYDQPLFMVEPA
jgi:acetyl-CoA carboxylase biotin carboxyl carrier protein